MAEFTPLTSKLVPLLMSDCDTDQIIPAQYVNAVGSEALAGALFHGRRQQPDFVLNRPEMAGRAIILAGGNFGCGSSREAAAWALAAGGFRALIGTTFNETFTGNCAKNGIPIVRLSSEAFAAVLSAFEADPRIEVTVDLARDRVSVPARGLSFPTGMEPFTRDLMSRGIDELSYLLEHRPLIDAYEAQLSGRPQPQ
jgi:3-isopropylmalate/(R)-2-methylmalate dehydratase small subunit